MSNSKSRYETRNKTEDGCYDCGDIIQKYSRRGLCAACYQRRYREGSVDEVVPLPVFEDPDLYMFYMTEYFPQLAAREMRQVFLDLGWTPPEGDLEYGRDRNDGLGNGERYEVML